MSTIVSTVLLFLFLGCWNQSHAAISEVLLPLISRDSIENVWIVFTDKQGTLQDVTLSPKARRRRSRSGYPQATHEDIPVTQAYLDAVQDIGAKKRHVSKWVNAASFSVNTKLLPRIDTLPFVREIFPVAQFKRTLEKPLGKKKAQSPEHVSRYGDSFHQLSMIGVAQAQNYLQTTLGEKPGEDILIGMFDTGFWLNHDCFNHMHDGAIVGDSDFVDLDGSVADPDSVRQNSSHPYHHSEEHGSHTLSLIGGYDPGNFIGAAWGAKFVLARTENDGVIRDGMSLRYIELHQEEDNWAVAVEWAESLGVDIISSSLGYRDGFTDRLGYPDTSLDYTYQDMDGKSTIIAAAAQRAAERGILVVNAMGNSGMSRQGTLSSPADVQDVISVGMVNPDRTINNASSTGPTADGRIKPDLVAQGFEISLPNLYDTLYSNSGWGTSFATPLVAGLVALVSQAHPDWTPQQVRERIYETCTFAPEQNEINNLYGRGIPDALWACLDSSTLYITVRDSIDDFVVGASVFAGETYLGESDSFGILLTDILPSDDTLIIRHEPFHPQKIAVAAGQTRVRARMDTHHYVRITLENRIGDSLNDPVLHYMSPDESRFTELSGARVFTLGVRDTGIYRFFGKAQYHYDSDTFEVAVDEYTDTLSLTIALGQWHYLPVTLVDSLNNNTRGGEVFWKNEDKEIFFSEQVDEWGSGGIYYPREGAYTVYAAAVGYHQSDPITINTTTSGRDTLRIILRPLKKAVVRLINQAGDSVPGGSVTWWPKDSAVRRITKTDSTGKADIDIDSPGSHYVLGDAPGYRQSDPYLLNTFLLESLTVVLTPLDNHIVVFISDTTGRPVTKGALHFRSTEQKQFSILSFDSLGTAAIAREKPTEYTFYVTAPGYSQSQSMSVPASLGADTVELYLQPREASRFAVFPNVVGSRLIRHNSTFKGITIDFLAAGEDVGDQLCKIAVRRFDGKIVWGYSKHLQPNKPLLDEFGRPLRWNCRAVDGSMVTPGTYIVIIRYDGNVHMKKVLITG